MNFLYNFLKRTKVAVIFSVLTLVGFSAFAQALVFFTEPTTNTASMTLPVNYTSAYHTK
jgi:hypothetical protein